jgi:hypothetical protein
MAIVQKFGQDPNKIQAPGTASMGFGQQGSAIGMGSNQQKPQGSGSFANLQKILGANQGQGQQLAQRVVGQGQQQAANVGNIQKRTSEEVGGIIGKEEEKQRTFSDPNEGIKAKLQGIASGKPEDTASGFNAVSTAAGGTLSDLASGANNLNQAASALASGGATAAGALGNLRTSTEALGTETGRAGMLSQLLRRPGYGSGSNALDQALMQTQGAQQLSTGRSDLVNQMNAANQAQMQLADKASVIKQLGTSSGDISEQLKQLLGGVSSNIDRDLSAKAEEANANAAAEAARLVSGDAKSMEAIGLDPNTKTYKFKLTPEMLKSIITPTTFTKEDVVSQDQASAFEQLKSLLGTGTTYTPPATKKSNVQINDTGKQAISQGIEQAKTGYLTQGKAAGLSADELETGKVNWENRFNKTDNRQSSIKDLTNNLLNSEDSYDTEENVQKVAEGIVNKISSIKTPAEYESFLKTLNPTTYDALMRGGPIFAQMMNLRNELNTKSSKEQWLGQNYSSDTLGKSQPNIVKAPTSSITGGLKG